MPATIANFVDQLSAATEIDAGDYLIVHDTSAGVPKKVTAGVAATPVLVTNATTYAVLAANSGRLHVLPDFSSSCTLTLPTAAAGLVYEFMYGGAAADAQNAVIASASASNFFKGGVVHLDVDSGTGADEIVTVFANGSTNAKITLTTPACGTTVKVVCDGTNWFLNGVVASATAPTIADLP